MTYPGRPAQRMHDRMVWSLWVQAHEAGVPAMFEASVPAGRADLLLFEGNDPVEIVEVKFRDAIKGIGQLASYRDSLHEYGYTIRRITLAGSAEALTPEVREGAVEAGVGIRILTESDERMPPYDGPNYRDPRWKAGGWCGYWQSPYGYLRDAA